MNVLNIKLNKKKLKQQSEIENEPKMFRIVFVLWILVSAKIDYNLHWSSIKKKKKNKTSIPKR